MPYLDDGAYPTDYFGEWGDVNDVVRRPGEGEVFVTIQDMMLHLLDWVGADGGDRDRASCKRALMAAVRQWSSERTWNFYKRTGRLVTMAPFTTGTVTVDVTGGAYERMVTLSSGTWPDWAPRGVLRINNVGYEVEAKKSATILTLRAETVPSVDITVPVGFALYRQSYTLPEDFDRAADPFSDWRLRSADARELVGLQRVSFQSGTPTAFAVVGDPDVPGRLAIMLYPAPDGEQSIDYLYQRRLPLPVIENVDDGTCSVVYQSRTVSGSGTSWSSSMVGAVIRFSPDGNETPTDFAGANPAAFEAIVESVTNGQEIIIDRDAPQSLTGVRYSISSRIDVEDGPSLVAFQRLAEMQLAVLRPNKDRVSPRGLYQEALSVACRVDSKTFERKVVGGRGGGLTRMADMPMGDDE